MMNYNLPVFLLVSCFAPEYDTPVG